MARPSASMAAPTTGRSRGGHRSDRRRSGARAMAVIETVGAGDSRRTDREKSPSRRRARRTRSAPVNDAVEAASSPGSRSLAAKSPNQWCQRSPSKSSRPTLVAGFSASSTVAMGHVRVGAGPVELVVAVAQQAERVVVVAEPDVEAVLLHPLVLAPVAGPLAAQPAAPLIDRDALEALLPARFAQPPRGRHAAHPPAEDGDPSSVSRCSRGGRGQVVPTDSGCRHEPLHRRAARRGAPSAGRARPGRAGRGARRGSSPVDRRDRWRGAGPPSASGWPSAMRVRGPQPEGLGPVELASGLVGDGHGLVEQAQGLVVVARRGHELGLRGQAVGKQQLRVDHLGHDRRAGQPARPARRSSAASTHARGQRCPGPGDRVGAGAGEGPEVEPVPPGDLEQLDRCRPWPGRSRRPRSAPRPGTSGRRRG